MKRLLALAGILCLAGSTAADITTRPGGVRRGASFTYTAVEVRSIGRGC